MKPLINLLRVTVLAACAVWLMTRMPSVHAQLMNCEEYNTENDVDICPDCCTGHPILNSWTDGTSVGAGIQVLDTQYANCGSPQNSCPAGKQ